VLPNFSVIAVLSEFVFNHINIMKNHCPILG